MKISKYLLSIFLISIVFISCDDDEDSPILPKGDYENGILISGEGSGTSSGTVSFVSNDFSTIEHQIFSTVNGSAFGTYLQSIAFDNDRAFIVTDNQNTVTVVDRYTFKELALIGTGLSNPRYMTIFNGLGYITNWGNPSDETDDFIAEVDLNTYEIINTIAVGNGPERIVSLNGTLFVSHKGAWSTNNIVTAIDIATKSTTEIEVKDNPDELFLDKSGFLVVLSEGRTIYDASWNVIGQTPAAITRINTSANSVINEIVFPDGQNPSLMAIDNTNFYYNLGSKIYSLEQTASNLSSTEIIDTGASYLYGLNAKNGYLFTLDTSFTGQSTMNVFDVNAKSKTFTSAAPIAASKIYFN
jgi:hypothetical protein